MEHVVSTLIPIFTLILLGYFFKNIKFPSVEFWPMADKFTYYVLMPSLLVYKVATSNIDLKETLDLVSTALLSILFVFFSLMVLNFFIKFNNKAFTSVMQGGIRFNTYVFLAFVDSVYGEQLKQVPLCSSDSATNLSPSFTGLLQRWQLKVSFLVRYTLRVKVSIGA